MSDLTAEQVAAALFDASGPFNAPPIIVGTEVELFLRRSTWHTIRAAALAWLTEHDGVHLLDELEAQLDAAMEGTPWA